MMDRRSFLAAALVSAGTLVARRAGAAVPMGTGLTRPPLTVYKDPSCGCCKAWVAYMEKSGFAVTAHDDPDMDAIKDHYGVPSGVRSCHTALIGSYVIEGHVPAGDVDRMLTEQPKVAGLALPGMVMGSPGMEGAMSKPYTVVAFQKTGSTTSFASHS
ncbi:MAG: DUF411 domain-containing protein [Gemmatimonadaceae bacterium]|nr:DUF411 domain-containing protein [Gemmatimonadaceae bacterium]